MRTPFYHYWCPLGGESWHIVPVSDTIPVSVIPLEEYLKIFLCVLEIVKLSLPTMLNWFWIQTYTTIQRLTKYVNTVPTIDSTVVYMVLFDDDVSCCIVDWPRHARVLVIVFVNTVYDCSIVIREWVLGGSWTFETTRTCLERDWRTCLSIMFIHVCHYIYPYNGGPRQRFSRTMNPVMIYVFRKFACISQHSEVEDIHK